MESANDQRDWDDVVMDYDIDRPLERIVEYGQGSLNRAVTVEGLDEPQYLYPVLSAPIRGGKRFACPEDHIASLERFLPDCEKYLAIGTSGTDEDLQRFLSENVRSCRVVHCVSVGEDVWDMMGSFYNGVRPFREVQLQGCNAGFAEYVLSDKFREFCQVGG